ncbi:uncharacterized protein BYT42DRAFT_579443 [Radiomyces spectabilis]|uniref:uncharacterized protein n=1 Tax=Radiomyces spectabilis TaxID=64574 RepID=UPI002220199C|nr:uncharacterized protein BYT42DRAFT_579443 [Radiomyces spectabilis]KAI8373171.1 hypothetical protein BYT42DRAFT_579443 [Radiomyces spectabilis]
MTEIFGLPDFAFFFNSLGLFIFSPFFGHLFFLIGFLDFDMPSYAEQTVAFLERHQHAAKLTLTAVAASALTAAAILSVQASRRKLRTRSLKEELHAAHLQQTKLTPLGTVEPSLANVDSNTLKDVQYDESLIEEQLARNIAFLGEDGVNKVRQSFVVVMGAGSIGSWAALMLIRSGVQNIRIVDPEQVTLGTLTRHATATLEDVGTSKAMTLKKHFNQIAPFVKVDSRTEAFTLANAEELLSGNPDFVVDALDDARFKVQLIKYCRDRQINVMTTSSPGAKADPTRIQICDISDTFDDPLMTSIRRRLRKLGVDREVAVVHSIEQAYHIHGHSQGKRMEDFPMRNLPTLGPIASMFGMAIATYVILQLANFTAYKLPPMKIREGTYVRIQNELATRENKVYGNRSCELDVRDVEYILHEMWHEKSVLSGPQDRLAFVRWDRSKPLSYFNTVCMNRDEARAHDALPADADLRQTYGHAVVDFIERQIENEKRFQQSWHE